MRICQFSHDIRVCVVGFFGDSRNTNMPLPHHHRIISCRLLPVLDRWVSLRRWWTALVAFLLGCIKLRIRTHWNVQQAWNSIRPICRQALLKSLQHQNQWRLNRFLRCAAISVRGSHIDQSSECEETLIWKLCVLQEFVHNVTTYVFNEFLV